MSPQNLAENIRKVRERIARATAGCGRTVDSVTLLAAGKSQPATLLRSAAQAGLQHFGENYLQEAQEKMESLRDLALTWHFIGQIQSNKTRPIAEHFAWVHTVDRLRIAQRLAEQRPYHAPPLNVCLQVNIANEPSKGGAAPADVPALAAAVAQLSRLRLRGLMCLPPAEDDPVRQRYWFARTRQLLESLGTGLDTLSMGMSADLESAVAEGSTVVRIGTALFGPRPTP